MNPNIDLLVRNINSPTLTTEIRESFYALQDKIDPEFVPFLKKLIEESKNEKITKMSLETLNFYRETMDDEQLENTNKLLGEIIKRENSPLEVRKEAIIQRGYFSEWPDTALRNIIEKENELELKIFAFRSILTELKLPYQVIDLETSLAISGEIKPNFDRINQVTQARADGHFDHLSSEQ